MARTKEIWCKTGLPLVEVSNTCKFRYSIDVNGKKQYFPYKPKITKKPAGYLRVFLDKTYVLHRLIASLFVPNPDNLPQVNHIDGNKENNKASNLEWVTIQQNCLHSHYKLGNESSKPKRPVNIYRDGRLIFGARSVNEAARYIDGDTSAISKACKGDLPEYKSFTFQYA